MAWNFGETREKDIVRWIRQGFGQGEGDSFLSFYPVHRSHSGGRLGRHIGIIHETRVYQALSDGEDRWVQIKDWETPYIDLCENKLLDRDETVAIARAAGIPHPWNRRDDRPYPFVEDIVAASLDGSKRRYHPFTVKMRKDLNNPRVFELMEICRRYWALRGATLQLLIKEEASVAMFKALVWAAEGRLSDGLGQCSQAEFAAMCDTVRDAIDRQRFEKVGDLYRALQSRFGVSNRTAQLALKNQLARHRVVTSMESVVSPHDDLARLKVSEPPHRMKAAWR